MAIKKLLLMKLIKDKKIISILLVLIFSSITIFIFSKGVQDLPPINSLNYKTFFYCVTLYILYLVITSYRYYDLLKNFQLESFNFIRWFMVYVYGRFLNKIVFQSGNIYRAVLLKSSNKLPYEKYVASLVTFSWMDLIISLLTSVIALLIISDSIIMINHFTLSSIILTALFFVILVPFFIRYLYKKFKVFDFIPKMVRESSEYIIKAFEEIQIKLLIKNILYGFIAFLIISIIFYFAFSILNVYPGLIKIIIYTSLTKLIMAYQFIPGNIGIQELSLGYLAELTGIGMAVGISVSIIFRFNAYLTLGILSSIFLLMSKDDIT